jgi:hypothetical protein
MSSEYQDLLSSSRRERRVSDFENVFKSSARVWISFHADAMASPRE